MEAAYKSVQVAGFRPTTAPNPSCCSSPHLLCPTCARLALNDLSNNYDPYSDPDISGHVSRNSGQLVRGAINNQQKETEMCMNQNSAPDDGPLRLPTINWQADFADVAERPMPGEPGTGFIARHSLTTNAAPKHDDEPLRLPVVNWHEPVH